MSEPQADARERHNRAQIAYFEKAGRHAMRPTDSHYVLHQVDRLVAFAGLSPGERVLDVGCGMGRYTLPLADRGLSVDGMDISESLLERFRQFDPGGRVTLHRADVVDPPDELRGRFDAVVGFFTLHHLHDLRACMRSMRMLLGPRGRVVFLEPNPLNPLYYVQMLVVPGMSWSGDRGILQMRPGTVFAAMADAGLRDRSLDRFGFFPPFVTNRDRGLALERRLERVRAWQPLLPFQLFRGAAAE